MVELAQQLAQSGFEPRIDLDRRARARRARPGAADSTARPAADLEHDVVVGQLGEPFDHAEDVAVDEEVLAE